MVHLSGLSPGVDEENVNQPPLNVQEGSISLFTIRTCAAAQQTDSGSGYRHFEHASQYYPCPQHGFTASACMVMAASLPQDHRAVNATEEEAEDSRCIARHLLPKPAELRREPAHLTE
jgi:hypothetical protein